MEVRHLMDRIQVTDDMESLLPGDVLHGVRVRHDQDIGEAMTLMQRHRLATLPVVKHRKVVGSVSRDRILEALRAPRTNAVGDAA